MNKMQNICYIILLCFIPISLFSQNTATGMVKNVNSEPISYSNVRFLDVFGRFIVGTVTDDDGKFEISVPDSMTMGKIIASYVGMTSDTLLWSEYTGKNLSFYLSDKNKSIGEVKVTGTRNLFKIKGDVIAVDVENTILSNCGIIDNLMNQIPFVTGMQGCYEVFGRGEAIVYINSRKVLDKSEIMNLTADRIKKIEVVTNPGAKYPANIGAVIKIITKDNPDGLGGSSFALIQYGRRLTHYENASFTINKGCLQLYGGLSYNDVRQKVYSTDSTITHGVLDTYNIDDVTIEYAGRIASANIGLDYSFSEYKSLSCLARLTCEKQRHDICLNSIGHFSDGICIFSTGAKARSAKESRQGTANILYSVKLGKAILDITDDILIGKTPNSFQYLEQVSSMGTSGNMSYFMNSTVCDMTVPISTGISLNYGCELTVSNDRQMSDFEEHDIDSRLSVSETERRQLLLCAYSDLRIRKNILSVNAGLRYEYAGLDYYNDGVKSNMLSRNYSHLFPSFNLSVSPCNKLNLCAGYKMSISRPSYSLLNDNLQCNSRYAYVKGNSMLKSQLAHSINMLISCGNLKLTGSCEIIKNACIYDRNKYSKGSDIILSEAVNIDCHRKITAGCSWWYRFGLYTPYIEITGGKQFFEYSYIGHIRNYNRPYYNWKSHHTLSLPKDMSVMLFIDYYGERFSLFREFSDRWSSQLSVSKTFYGGWYVQVSLNNVFCPDNSSSITYCKFIKDGTYSINDYRNIAFNVTYNFNYKQQKHYLNTKTSEIKRY